MKRFTLREAQTSTGGSLVYHDAADAPVLRWAFDSRLPFAADGACFLALGTGARRGASFIPQLIERGVRMFCVSATDFDTLPTATQAGAAFWVVEDVLSSVQALAREARQRIAGPVLAITGSNGKTIVKEWTHALLSEAGLSTYRSPGSYNSQLGVALSLLHADADAAIIEAGVSEAGDMASLAHMIRPSLGLLTNLGAAHDAGFTDRREKLREKLSLFGHCDRLVYCADDAWLHGEVKAWAAQAAPQLRLLAWSSTEAHASAGNLGVRFNDTQVSLSLDSGPLTLPCPFADAASRQNLAHAVIAALSLPEDRKPQLAPVQLAEVLAKAIQALPHEEMRLQAYAGRDGTRVVDDSYSADLEGFAAAAEFFTQQALPTGPRVWFVGLPRIRGAELSTFYGDIVGLAQRADVTELYTVGVDPDCRRPLAGRHFPSTEAALSTFDQLSLKHATVLVKGPRAARLDLIARRLRERSHELRLEISLSALAHNIGAYRSRLAVGTKACVMVKAQAYGSGGAEVAAFFEQRGVDYLAVATVDEAVEIRKQGVRLPIIVAHVLPEELHLVRTHALEPEVSSLAQLRIYASVNEDRDPELGVPLHLKVDTGMRRLGFDATTAAGAGLVDLLAELRTGKYSIRSVFSHLSASDRPDADAFSRKQNRALVDAVDHIATALAYRPMVHLLNSAGAWRMPELQHDMVRLGLGVYGLGLEAAAPGVLEPAHRWVAHLVQIRDVAAGDVVGYNLGGVADVNRRIGVVNVGYADGLRRSASNGAYALSIDGRRCPTVGSVCMDFTMVNLANCPGAQVGDAVEIFGRDQSVGALAAVYDTIAYEVFTGIGPRVRRVFYR